jgi:hypothetical protein
VKKRAPIVSRAVVTHAPSPDWVEVKTKDAAIRNVLAGALEVRIGSCVVSVSPGFDKPLFAEVCKALLSL